MQNNERIAKIRARFKAGNKRAIVESFLDGSKLPSKVLALRRCGMLQNEVAKRFKIAVSTVTRYTLLAYVQGFEAAYKADVAHLLDEVDRLTALLDWQPIDEVPKEHGVPILLWIGGGVFSGPYVAYYSDVRMRFEDELGNEAPFDFATHWRRIEGPESTPNG